MALTLNTTVLSGQTVVTDSTNGGIAIDYTTLYGRIATALETIATNSTAIKNSISSIATSQGTIATNHALIATSQGTIATNHALIATSQGTIATNHALIATGQGTIALKQTAISTKLNALTDAATTGDGLKMISPFEWLYGVASIPATADFENLTARYETLSKSLPRYFK
jgi:hypothetical protein